MAVFPRSRPPKIFFKIRALSLLYPFGALASYQKLEKTVFDLQIIINTVHSVQTSSRSDLCITTEIMWKTPKMPKKWQSLKNLSLRYLKTDGRTNGQTDGQEWLHRTPADKPGSKMFCWPTKLNVRIFLDTYSYLKIRGFWAHTSISLNKHLKISLIS